MINTSIDLINFSISASLEGLGTNGSPGVLSYNKQEDRLDNHNKQNGAHWCLYTDSGINDIYY